MNLDSQELVQGVYLTVDEYMSKVFLTKRTTAVLLSFLQAPPWGPSGATLDQHVCADCHPWELV